MQLRYKSWQDGFGEMGQSESKMHLENCMGERSQGEKKKRKESNKVGL